MYLFKRNVNSLNCAMNERWLFNFFFFEQYEPHGFMHNEMLSTSLSHILDTSMLGSFYPSI